MNYSVEMIVTGALLVAGAGFFVVKEYASYCLPVGHFLNRWFNKSRGKDDPGSSDWDSDGCD